ncbi:hypothetical protein Q3G72_017626 [Acer saccharum]|nr:hypothetical protein Q3G72_017626 [Acer saccharum]
MQDMGGSSSSFGYCSAEGCSSVVDLLELLDSKKKKLEGSYDAWLAKNVWRCWQNRNMVVHGLPGMCANELLEWSRNYVSEFSNEALDKAKRPSKQQQGKKTPTPTSSNTCDKGSTPALSLVFDRPTQQKKPQHSPTTNKNRTQQHNKKPKEESAPTTKAKTKTKQRETLPKNSRAPRQQPNEDEISLNQIKDHSTRSLSPSAPFSDTYLMMQAREEKERIAKQLKEEIERIRATMLAKKERFCTCCDE